METTCKGICISTEIWQKEDLTLNKRLNLEAVIINLKLIIVKIRKITTK